MVLAAALALALSTCVLLLPSAPADGTLVLLLAGAALLPAWAVLGPRGPLVVLVVAASALTATRVVAGRLPASLAGADLLVRGVICDFPRVQADTGRFVLDVEPDETSPGLPRRLLVNWYEGSVAPAIGERWQFRVRVKADRGLLGPGVPDFERWLFAARIGATGYVRPGSASRRLGVAGGACPGASLRGEIARRATALLDDPAALPYVLGLSVGAYSALPAEEWDLLRLTGAVHLISISGFHLALVAAPAALLGAWLARLLLALGVRCVPRIAGALVALACASAYAVLAGGGIPTLRSLVMLAAGLLVLVLRSRWRAGDVLGAAILVVLALDPLAALSPGFWLSFAGVALLVLAARLPGGQSAGRGKGWGRRLGAAARVLVVTQGVISAGLAPLLVAWFGQLPLAGALANLVAVPLFSLAIIPTTLAGAALALVNDVAARGLLGLAALAISAWRTLMGWCAALPLAVLEVPDLGAIPLALLALGAACLLWPAPAPARLSGLLMFAALAAGPATVPPGGLRVVVFDVGQGLATLVQTAHHALVYDTGPAWRGGEAGSRSVNPGLRALGLRDLDTVVISHGDADHRGGAGAVLGRHPGAAVLANDRLGLPPGRVPEPCVAGRSWSWDGVSFRVLHPPARGAPPDDNNRSCVLAVRSGGAGLLLPGDLEGEGEESLARGGGLGPVDVVVVPHHGSRTSSSPALVEATRPGYALVASGFGNRWKFPAPAVVARWQAAGARVLDTATAGAIVLEAAPGGPLRPVLCYRVHRRHLWTAPGPGDCG